MLVQPKYYPAYQSGAGLVQTTTYNHAVSEHIDNINTSEEVDFLEIDVNYLCDFYSQLSRKADSILGGGANSGWLQLWKNILWNKKQPLEGNIRLGIEYLQVDYMLKEFLQSVSGEMPDIDEVQNISPKDILRVCSDINPLAYRTTYSIRKESLSNKDGNNFYKDRNKRLFYLSNNFGLNYQPKVMVYVEGKCEQIALERLCKETYGQPLENFGVEIFNFEGVGQLNSTHATLQKLRSVINEISSEEKKKLLTNAAQTKLNQVINSLDENKLMWSNFTNILSYQISRWQIIPFFIGDDEGNVSSFLNSNGTIKIGSIPYRLPREWFVIWGDKKTTEKEPFKGENFELANFTDKEIQIAIRAVLNIEVSFESVKELRRHSKSINSLDKRIEGKKVEICGHLLNQASKDLMSRPIGSVFLRIIELASQNHLPTNRKLEIENQAFILNKLVKMP